MFESCSRRSSSLSIAAGAAAQTTTGTISGRVLDVRERRCPVRPSPPSHRTCRALEKSVTSEHGDYILTGLPSGPYTITFSLSGFQAQTRNVVLAPTQVLPLEVTLGPAQVTEEVTVVGQR